MAKKKKPILDVTDKELDEADGLATALFDTTVDWLLKRHGGLEKAKDAEMDLFDVAIILETYLMLAGSANRTFKEQMNYPRLLDELIIEGFDSGFFNETEAFNIRKRREEIEAIYR